MVTRQQFDITLLRRSAVLLKSTQLCFVRLLLQCLSSSGQTQEVNMWSFIKVKRQRLTHRNMWRNQTTGGLWGRRRARREVTTKWQGVFTGWGSRKKTGVFPWVCQKNLLICPDPSGPSHCRVSDFTLLYLYISFCSPNGLICTPPPRWSVSFCFPLCPSKLSNSTALPLPLCFNHSAPPLSSLALGSGFGCLTRWFQLQQVRISDRLSASPPPPPSRLIKW